VSVFFIGYDIQYDFLFTTDHFVVVVNVTDMNTTTYTCIIICDIIQ